MAAETLLSRWPRSDVRPTRQASSWPRIDHKGVHRVQPSLDCPERHRFRRAHARRRVLRHRLPKADASAQEIASYLADSANHMRNIIGAYLWVLGGLAFLGFVAGLRSVLRRAEGDPGTFRA